ncbi:MAG: DUF5615 family PIN-like protein [Deltaproteobacteria bacterium]|nr:DUF5615 family PIN-like protein [Deltaproteobacteria bacterium]
MGVFKLDENLSPALKEPLVAAGHDVATVAEEGLQGAPDERVAEACRGESRCLITADEDFAQIIRYPPALYSGLVVLRHPRPSLRRLRDLLRQVVSAVEMESPQGKLWIVEPGRIRIHDPAEGA